MEQHNGEEAFEILSEGIGRRDLFRGAAAIGAGAVVPAWMLSPGVKEAFGGPNGVAPDLEIGYDDAPGGPGPRVLQPGQGRIVGRYLRSTPGNVRWGFLPNRDSLPEMTVNSGAVVTIDTVSHEGLLEDQGRDPVEYFGNHGVRPGAVLRDARDIARSDLEHDFYKAGPHIVTGPIAVRGARPGDVLRVDVVGLVPRVPYGVVSNRHGKGALPGEFPTGPAPDPAATPANPEAYRNVSIFTPVRNVRGRDSGVIPAGPRFTAVFPIDPFMGITGVAADTSEPVPSVPPTKNGGNIDIADLTVGSTIYLPVAVDGAKFFVGDPHYRQGHGEVALTAWEASLRGTFRLTLLKQGSRRIPGGRGTLDTPLGETAEYWIPVGLDPDLDEALKAAVREAMDFLNGEYGMPREAAFAYMSAATDFIISQVVDKTKGVHARIRKSDLVRTRASFLDQRPSNKPTDNRR